MSRTVISSYRGLDQRHVVILHDDYFVLTAAEYFAMLDGNVSTEDLRKLSDAEADQLENGEINLFAL